MLEPQRIAKFLHVEVPIRSLGPIELAVLQEACLSGPVSKARRGPLRFPTN